MGIKGLDWNDVDARVPVIAARRTSFTAGDEICRFLKAHYGGRAAVEATIRDAMKEAYIAGIYAAAECEYRPGNEEIARLLNEARAELRTAAPEGRHAANS